MIELEKNISYSESIYWRNLSDKYKKRSTKMWEQGVPFYLTSNSLNANAYANIIIRFVQDSCVNGKIDPKEPVYIIEVGAGHGLFSHYLIKRLFELQLQLQLQLSHIKLRYIMTDQVAGNIEFWRNHPQFQQYLTTKQLDFARYDLAKDESLTLLNSGKTLKAGNCRNPAIVFANWVFLILPYDLFWIKDKTLYAGLASSKMVKNRKPKPKLKTTFNFQPCSTNYYKDPKLNSILAFYKDNLSSSTANIPVAGITCLRNMLNITNNKLLLLISDAGYTSLESLPAAEIAVPTKNFRYRGDTPVNFHAIGKYTEACGGAIFHQDAQRKTLHSSAFVVGQKFTSLPETSLALQTHFNDSAPIDYFSSIQYGQKWPSTKQSLESIISNLSLWRWDPYLFHDYLTVILKKLKQASTSTKELLLSKLPELERNFYFMTGRINLYFDIAEIHSALENKDAAQHYYKLAVEHFNYFAAYTNIHKGLALCYARLGDAQNAKKQLFLAYKQETNST